MKRGLEAHTTMYFTLSRVMLTEALELLQAECIYSEILKTKFYLRMRIFLNHLNIARYGKATQI